MSDFQSWLNEKSSDEWFIYLKRLSANDTGATGAHQVGVYIHAVAWNRLFPRLNRTDIFNPDHILLAKTSSHDFAEQQVRAVYYNGAFFGKTRNEKRITRWGGKGSPIQNEDNTGALVVFAFKLAENDEENCNSLDVWVCRSIEDEDIIESMTGIIAPGVCVFGEGSKVLSGFAVEPEADIGEYNVPGEWYVEFPSGIEIITYLPTIFKFKSKCPDELIVERRKKEYSLFRYVEEIHVLGRVQKGFDTVDDFINMANSVSNRRKSRSGKSLEMHLEIIFESEGLTTFETQCVTEINKKPDFIFPSGEKYHDPDFPPASLRMLAVKTTCKDRWRQVINEVNRDKIKTVFLFTLQEGVSVNQFDEMTSEGVCLVVPEPLHDKYPKEIRDKLITLASFIKETKELCSMSVNQSTTEKNL